MKREEAANSSIRRLNLFSNQTLQHYCDPFFANSILRNLRNLWIMVSSEVLFVIGATALLLLFIGIHNAWDTVTYITVEQAQTPEEPEDHDG